MIKLISEINIKYRETTEKSPPNEALPTSPIKISAGFALNHKKPRHEPTIAPQKIDVSPTFSMYGICKYSEKTLLPTT